jgi:hypothetical protein
VGFPLQLSSPHAILTCHTLQQEHRMAPRIQSTKLAFNADAAAILIALALAALIRLNLIPHIGW